MLSSLGALGCFRMELCRTAWFRTALQAMPLDVGASGHCWIRLVGFNVAFDPQRGRITHYLAREVEWIEGLKRRASCLGPASSLPERA